MTYTTLNTGSVQANGFVCPFLARRVILFALRDSYDVIHRLLDPDRLTTMNYFSVYCHQDTALKRVGHMSSDIYNFRSTAGNK